MHVEVKSISAIFKITPVKRDKRSFAGCRYLSLANFSFEMEFWTNLWTVNLQYITTHNLQSTNWSKLRLKAETKKKKFLLHFYCLPLMPPLTADFLGNHMSAPGGQNWKKKQWLPLLESSGGMWRQFSLNLSF